MTVLELQCSARVHIAYTVESHLRACESRDATPVLLVPVWEVEEDLRKQVSESFMTACFCAGAHSSHLMAPGLCMCVSAGGRNAPHQSPLLSPITRLSDAFQQDKQVLYLLSGEILELPTLKHGVTEQLLFPSKNPLLTLISYLLSLFLFEFCPWTLKTRHQKK